MTLIRNRLAQYCESKATTSTGTMTGPCVLRGIHYNDTSGGQAGSVTLRDGGDSGDIKLQVHTPGNGTGDDVVIPGGGIVFETDIHATLDSVDGLTILFSR